jgi:ABC-type transport system involved in Fe-S cluster assembly fused permease/ATPase subunit
MDAKITSTIKECFAGMTMLVIAHRLATIMHLYVPLGSSADLKR